MENSEKEEKKTKKNAYFQKLCHIHNGCLKKYRTDLLMITYRVEAFQLIYVILWVAC